jgi:hypothetical protein
MVQLDDELVELLDEEAAKANLSRSALIRSILRAYVDAESERAQIERLVEGYRRHPQPTIDEWGNLDEQLDAGGRDVARHLDAEEQAAGFAPW